MPVEGGGVVRCFLVTTRSRLSARVFSARTRSACTSLEVNGSQHFYPVLAALLLATLLGTSARAQVSVSDNGAPTFGYPIAVPPGVGGVTPKLALQHVGGGINGPLGLGWSLQGLSSITRCPASRVIDGVRTNVVYGPADKLCLDGQRLIQSDAAGTPLASQVDDSRGVASGTREFRTEKDVYARIRAYGVANGSDVNGPTYFKVWTKSGLIYEYGAAPTADANSKGLVAAYGKNAVMVWAVTRVSDTAGNYMDFKYEQRDVAWGSGPAGGTTGREWNIAEIQYTGRVGQSATNKIIFEYTDRTTDRAEAYHQGSKNVSVRLLQNIHLWVNSPNPTVLGPAVNAVKAKTIKLNYQAGVVTQRNTISRIAECDAAGTKCLPATVLTYAFGGTDAYQANAAFRNSSLATLPMQSTLGDLGILVADFNGDGRSDIIRWANDPAANQLWLSNGDGNFTQVPNGAGAGQFNVTDQNLFKNDGCYASMVADFNADGLPDIFRYSNAANAGGAVCATFGQNYIYFARGDGSFNRVQVTSPALSRLRSITSRRCGTANCQIEPLWLRSWTSGSNFYFMDVNADGRLDIVTTLLPSQSNYDEADGPPPDACVSQTCTRVYLGNGDGTFAEIATNVANRSLYSTPPAAYSLARETQYSDVDGDGVVDLVGMTLRYSNSAPGWRSRGDGSFDPLTIQYECSFPIDFNGDQRPDCIAFGVGGGLLIANGTTSIQATANFNLSGQTLFSPGPYPNGAGSAVIDINGDGRHDLLRWRDDPAQNVVFVSNGDGTFTQSPSFNLTTGDNVLQSTDGTTGFVVSDFTGGGIPEILRVKHAPSTASEATRNQLYVKPDSSQPDQLVSVRSPTGALTTLSYVTLANAGSALGPRYVTDRDAANTSIYPRLHLTFPTSVVSTLATDSGVGTSTTLSEYSYKGLKAEWNGRGLLGFSEIRRESQGPDGNYLTNFTQNLQTHPYIGVASRSDTRRGRLNDTTATLLSSAIYVYCDKTAAAGAEASATVSQPCPTSAKIQRPYLRQSVETGSDLNGVPLPTVTTTNTFSTAGDPTTIVITTAGTVAGLSETYTKTTTNTYLPDNTVADSWILGRLQRATVRSVAPNSFASLAVSAGSASNATATAGVKDVLTPSISPASISQVRSTAGSLSATATVTVGGFPTPPLTYAWTRVAGTTSLITATPASGSSNSTTFSATLALNQSANETYRVTVTDSIGRVGTKDILVSFFAGTPPLTISVAPTAPAASRNNPGPITTASTATPSGGVAPFTYNWTRVTGSRITVSNGSTATATFSATLGWGENLSESFQVAVTDAASQAKTASVTVTFTSPTAPAISITPSALTITGSSPGTVSGSVTATGSGGVPPYVSYAWSRVTGSRIAVTGNQTATFSTSVAYDENFMERFLITATDSVGNQTTQTLDVTAVGPPSPAPLMSISPTSYAYGTIDDGAFVNATFTITNSGGAGVISISLVRSNGGLYSFGARSCPADGAVMGGFTSCAVDVSFTGVAQCGGQPTPRLATVTVTVGSSSASTSLSATNRVYSVTALPCR